MATPNIVPRATGEGGLGTAALGWGGAFVTNKTTSSATEGGKLVLAANDGAVMAAGHRLGVIEFKGAEDGSGTLTNGARIQCVADSSTTWSGTENDAWLEFYTTDANASESKVLTLTHLKTAHFTGIAYFESSVDITSNIVVDGTGTFSGAGGVTINDATTSSATEGGNLILASNDGAVMGSGHRLGVIEFKGAEDTSNTLTVGARIEALCDAAWSGSENGADLVFYTTDGNAVQTEQMRCTAATGVSIPKRKFTPTGTGTNGTITGGDVVYFGGTTSMTAGAIYHYKSDGTWELADADAVATSDGLLAVALGAASDTNGMCLRGMVTIDHDPGAIGDVLFLSTTAGDCSATAPSGSADIVRVIGYQVNHASNGEIWFCPDGTYVELA
jgi:hypothetical protein